MYLKILDFLDMCFLNLMFCLNKIKYLLNFRVLCFDGICFWLVDIDIKNCFNNLKKFVLSKSYI